MEVRCELPSCPHRDRHRRRQRRRHCRRHCRRRCLQGILEAAAAAAAHSAGGEARCSPTPRSDERSQRPGGISSEGEVHPSRHQPRRRVLRLSARSPPEEMHSACHLPVLLSEVLRELLREALLVRRAGRKHDSLVHHSQCKSRLCDGPQRDGPQHDGPQHDEPQRDGPQHGGPQRDGFLASQTHVGGARAPRAPCRPAGDGGRWREMAGDGGEWVKRCGGREALRVDIA